MKRLIFCPGICQVMNAAAASDQDHGPARAAAEDVLVLFSHSPMSVYGQFVEKSAREVWPWREIRWAQDIVLWYFPTRKFAPIAREMLIRRFGSDVDEIWVSKLAIDSTKLVLYAFPDARVVLYEDGAVEYIPQEITCGRARWAGLRVRQWAGALKRELSHWNGRPECMELTGVCARDLRRVRKMYTFLGRHLGAPDYLASVPMMQVEQEVLRARYEALKAASDAKDLAQPPTAARDQVVLFLPQNFATIFLTEEDEYELYRRSVTALRAKGYRILWKEHPREKTPLAPRLQEVLGRECIELLPARQQLPVECLVAGWDLAAVVSVCSASLFYLHDLYGFACYTLADQIPLDRWLQQSERVMAELCLRTVPTLDVLPDVNS